MTRLNVVMHYSSLFLICLRQANGSSTEMADVNIDSVHQIHARIGMMHHFDLEGDGSRPAQEFYARDSIEVPGGEPIILSGRFTEIITAASYTSVDGKFRVVVNSAGEIGRAPLLMERAILDILGSEEIGIPRAHNIDLAKDGFGDVLVADLGGDVDVKPSDRMVHSRVAAIASRAIGILKELHSRGVVHGAINLKKFRLTSPVDSASSSMDEAARGSFVSTGVSVSGAGASGYKVDVVGSVEFTGPDRHISAGPGHVRIPSLKLSGGSIDIRDDRGNSVIRIGRAGPRSVVSVGAIEMRGGSTSVGGIAADGSRRRNGAPVSSLKLTRFLSASFWYDISTSAHITETTVPLPDIMDWANATPFALEQSPPSRRDDMFALSDTLYKLLNEPPVRQGSMSASQLARAKRIRPSLTGAPEEFVAFHHAMGSLRFDERPDYDHWIAVFDALSH